jgi:hypothetical protein
MYNEDVLKKLIMDFGEMQAMLFCRMESARNAYLFEDCIKNKSDDECKEFDFERDWWKEAEKKLSDNLKF